MRPEVWLKTRHDGDQPFKLIFYHEKEPAGGFSFDQLKKGNTLCVLYAERKTFMDLHDGVRQEDVDTVWVFKAPMAVVHREAKKLLDLADAGEGDVEHSCFGCGKPDATEKRHDRCGRCRLARYCSRACQEEHWRTAHKFLCKDSEKLLRLSCLDRHPFKVPHWFAMDSLPPHRKP
jgi:MYND finger